MYLCVCPCERPCVCVCVHECVHGSVCVCPCFCVCLCLSVCVHVSVSVSVCVRVFVCYNNGNFSEILRSAHPSGSKKELRVTHFCYLHLRFDSIFTPVNKRFQR
jgi:hypothetical protein